MKRAKAVISRASGADLPGVLALLARVGLPHEGVAEHLDAFLLARDAEGRVVGCIGAERYGRASLLRSAAVAPEAQGEGLGSRLVESLLEQETRAGVREVALLTTSARDFFQRKFGFEDAARADYEERFARSTEWRLPRCSSAVLMRLKLSETESE